MDLFDFVKKAFGCKKKIMETKSKFGRPVQTERCDFGAIAPQHLETLPRSRLLKSVARLH
jgi:hypothetical protein